MGKSIIRKKINSKGGRSSGGGGGGGVNSVTGSWVNNSDPNNPVVGTPFSNWTASSDPGVSNDDSQGYVIGSTWINTTAGRLFTAVDVTTGAAVWVSSPNSLNAITIDFQAFVALPVALIPYQLYKFTNWPLFNNGLSVINEAYFYTFNNGILNQFGYAFLTGDAVTAEISIDWYNVPGKIYSIRDEVRGISIFETSGSAGNVIMSGLWHTSGWNNVNIIDLQFLNIGSTPNISIINTNFDAGTIIDFNNKDNFNIRDSWVGHENYIVMVGSSSGNIVKYNSGDNVIFYCPKGTTTNLTLGAGNIFGVLSAIFNDVENCITGTGCEIWPVTTGNLDIKNCTWGVAKLHRLLQSAIYCQWVDVINTFEIDSDADVDVVGGIWTPPDGYGRVKLFSGTSTDTTINTISYNPALYELFVYVDGSAQFFFTKTSQAIATSLVTLTMKYPGDNFTAVSIINLFIPYTYLIQDINSQ